MNYYVLDHFFLLASADRSILCLFPQLIEVIRKVVLVDNTTLAFSNTATVICKSRTYTGQYTQRLRAHLQVCPIDVSSAVSI